MRDNIIAYNIAELEKKGVTDEAKMLYKSGVIDENQWTSIKKQFQSNLYTPSIFIRILLFLGAILGMLTSLGPIAFSFHISDEGGLRALAVIMGVAILIFTELVVIKNLKHFRSGVTEAGIYSSIILIVTGLVLENESSTLILAISLAFALFATIRYLDLLALVASVILFAWLIVDILMSLGGLIPTLLPIIMLSVFMAVYHYAISLEKRLSNIIFTDQFIILKSLSLLICYLSVNYFVVRELSVMLLDLEITEGGDIPLAFIFYGLTALLPLAYIAWGVKNRSILFIRVGLFILTLTVFTFKIYFSVMPPVIAITIAGTILTTISLLLLNYLKTPKKGFTRDRLLTDKWSNSNLHSFVISQSIGGNASTPQGDVQMGGGKFGGAGAGENW